MGQGYDEYGNELGPEQFGESFKDVFEKVNDAHRDAAEIRLRKLHETINEVKKSRGFSDAMCREIVARIDSVAGEGFAKKLAELINPKGTWPVE